MRDYYEILGIGKDASPDEIKKAYRMLAHVWHPDKNTNSDTNAMFQEIQIAYSVLIDPQKRLQYDNSKQNPFYDLLQAYYQQAEQERQQERVRYEEARREARENYRIRNEKLGEKHYEKNVNFYTIICWLGLFLGSLIIIDFILPSIESKETVVWRGGFINTNKRSIPVSREFAQFTLEKNSEIIVKFTPIFKTSKRIYFEEEGVIKTTNCFSIYNVFSFFLIGLMLTSTIGLWNEKKYKLVADMGIISFILLIINLFIVLSHKWG